MSLLSAVQPPSTLVPPLSRDFVGVPLAVVFASGEDIDAVRNVHRDSIELAAPLQVSDDDAYLVIPDDIGDEIVDILRDHDAELLHETLRDSLLVNGPLARDANGQLALHAEASITPQDALLDQTPYAHEIAVGGGEDPLQIANRMDHCQCTMLSALLDDQGLESMLRKDTYIGISWRVSADISSGLIVDPTYAFSRRLSDGRVGVEFALFVEEEDLIALLRPVVFRPSSK